MSLKIFQTQEKVKEEKELATINTKESSVDTIVAKLLHYFAENSNSNSGWRKCFEDYKNFMAAYQISPQIIDLFYNKIVGDKESGEIKSIPPGKDEISYRFCLGSFLSAMIQTSKNQGHNYFEFGEVDTPYFFGALIGGEDEPIKIRVQKLNVDYSFEDAKNCVIQIDNVDCTYFGAGMKYCQVHSANPQTLDKLKKLYNDTLERWSTTCGKGNSFVLGEIS